VLTAYSWRDIITFRNVFDEYYLGESYMNSVGERVRKLRNERGLTQLQLGEAIKVRQTTVSQIESGTNDPSIPVLRKLADYFDVKPGYFLDDLPAPSSDKVTA
jgi:transcriptional regulator with XRE-family HTH domain